MTIVLERMLLRERLDSGSHRLRWQLNKTKDADDEEPSKATELLTKKMR